MKTEFERIQNRQPMELLNMKRWVSLSHWLKFACCIELAFVFSYELPGPAAGKLTDVGAWQEAVDNSQAQLEHQAVRVENLELMTEYGADASKAFIYVLQRMVEAAQKQLSDLRYDLFIGLYV